MWSPSLHVMDMSKEKDLPTQNPSLKEERMSLE